MVTGGPPETPIVLSVFWATNAMERESGDQNGYDASSVPASGSAAKRVQHPNPQLNPAVHVSGHEREPPAIGRQRKAATRTGLWRWRKAQPLRECIGRAICERGRRRLSEVAAAGKDNHR